MSEETDRLVREIARLEDRLTTVRAQALEEAATAVEAMASSVRRTALHARENAQDASRTKAWRAYFWQRARSKDSHVVLLTGAVRHLRALALKERDMVTITLRQV